MRKQIVSACACIVLAVSFAAAAQSNGTAEGTNFAIALSGLPDDVYPNQPLSLQIHIEVYDDGTSRRKSVFVTTWIDTPLGHAVLSTNERRLLPGESYVFAVAFAYQRPIPSQTVPISVGVSATLKDETLEVVHTMRLHDKSE